MIPVVGIGPLPPCFADYNNLSICARTRARIEEYASYRREGKSAPVEKTGIFSLSLPFGNVEAQALYTARYMKARTAGF
jgi:hypothetical protein